MLKSFKYFSPCSCFSLLLICTSNLFSLAQGIKFEQPVWKVVLEKAKKENKIIFADCHTERCGWCRWMENHTYNNDTVGKFYNSNFICVSFDMHVGDGIEIAKKYKIYGVPTFLYLNSNGEVLQKTFGAKNVKTFIGIGKDVFNPEKQYNYYLNSFKRDSSNGEIAFKYFDMLAKADELDKDALKKYFITQKDSSLLSSINWKILYKFSYYSSHEFKFFENNIDAFYKIYGKDSIEKKINSVYDEELRYAYAMKDSKKLDLLRKKFRSFKTADCEKILLHTDKKLRKLPNADRFSAIEIEDSIVGPLNVSLGYGAFKEFKSSENADHMQEDNSVWFKFTIAYDTTLTFDIVPIDSLDDYDFVLYKCPDGNCADKNGKMNLKVERYCFSMCRSKSGMTGLSNYTKATSIGAGPGPAYVSSVHVKAGETYYLMVDYGQVYVNSGGNPLGFHIYFYDYYPKKKPIVIKNIFFENKKAVLQAESLPELDKLVNLLKKSQMVIEIRGHTDDIGDEKKNLLLSEERAKTVVDYLVSKQIKPNRLFYKGFGNSRPIADNNTEEGRKINRRVEFVKVLY